MFCRLIVAVALGLCLSAPVRSQTTVRPAPAGVDHVQPGDRLFVRVIGEPLLGDTVTVDARGRAVIPKIGLIDVSDFPLADIRDSLMERLSRNLRSPAIEVVVLRRIVVGGAVVHPDVYYVDVFMRLRDAIALAGGTTEAANIRDVSIFRERETIRLPNWQRDDSGASLLRSGDEVIVGRRGWLSMNLLQVSSLVVVAASLVVSLRR